MIFDETTSDHSEQRPERPDDFVDASQTRSDGEQTAADSDQTASDRDQTACEGDAWSASLDVEAAQADQRACDSDHDLAEAAHPARAHPTDEEQAAFEKSQGDRLKDPQRLASGPRLPDQCSWPRGATTPSIATPQDSGVISPPRPEIARASNATTPPPNKTESFEHGPTTTRGSTRSSPPRPSSARVPRLTDTAQPATAAAPQRIESAPSAPSPPDGLRRVALCDVRTTVGARVAIVAGEVCSAGRCA